MSRRHDVDGLPVYLYTGEVLSTSVKRTTLPRGLKRWVVHQGAHAYLYYSWPWSGTWLMAVYRRGDYTRATLWLHSLPLEVMKMRKLASVGAGVVMPALPRESKTFAKFPLYEEFMAATSYDDGTPRTPGYSTLRNRGHCYELTLYDYDSGLRLPISGPDKDHVYKVAEQLLGVPDAPWQPDDYLMGLLSKKKRK